MPTRSHLARHVYRSLRAHHCVWPISSNLHSHGLRRQLVPKNAVFLRDAPRRTIFGIFQKPPRQVKAPEVEPGYEVFLKFRKNETENERPPPKSELIQSFNDFFRFKNRYRKSVNSTQAFGALRVFKHLLDATGKFENLSRANLVEAREALLRTPSDRSENHVELCREIYHELRRRGAKSSSNDTTAYDPQSAPQTFSQFYTVMDLGQHLSALCQYGHSVEAVGLLASYWAQNRAENQSLKRDGELWLLVMAGLAREGKEQELLAQAEAAQAAGLDYNPVFHEIMTTFYAERNDLEKTKTWFGKPIHKRLAPTPRTYSEILKLSARGDAQRRWADTMFQELCDSNPYKELWDIIFQWAVVSLGKRVDEIDRMMETMVRHNEARPKVRPDIDTINALVRAAMDVKDALLAERFVQLGLQRGLNPDFHTFMLQLDYRIDANDHGGALDSFQALRDLNPPHDDHFPVVNKYVRALCSAGKVNTGRLLDVVGDVEQQQVTLEPATVAALCMVLLRHDLQYEVIDTLSLHTFQFSLDERKVVADAFVTYCRDGGNSMARTWDAYSLLRQFFPETPKEDRVRIMEGFFIRKRADMACSVFGHMRALTIDSLRPTSDTYIQCFEGLGRVPDPNSLRLVHNMLKMDTTIQMSTRLYNALMLAYATCGDPWTAVEFWSDITNSAEGPSYNSLAIVFRACEGMPFGDKKAREIWSQMQRMEVDVPDSVFNAYCGAIAGQGLVDEVQRLIADMRASVGCSPTAMTLGISYNALPGQSLRADFETWAAAEYPDLWQQLKKKTRGRAVDGLRSFKISRDLKA